MSDGKPAPDGVNTATPSGREGGGESGGGFYPNPHRGTQGESEEHDGGQSEKGYYGPGQLGGEKADEDAKGRVGQGG